VVGDERNGKSELDPLMGLHTSERRIVVYNRSFTDSRRSFREESYDTSVYF